MHRLEPILLRKLHLNQMNEIYRIYDKYSGEIQDDLAEFASLIAQHCRIQISASAGYIDSIVSELEDAETSINSAQRLVEKLRKRK